MAKSKKSVIGYWTVDLDLQCPHCEGYLFEADELEEPLKDYKGEITCELCGKKFNADITSQF